jgi:hypothetical protein
MDKEFKFLQVVKNMIDDAIRRKTLDKKFGAVTAINANGTLQVLPDGSTTAVTVGKCCNPSVGQRVLILVDKTQWTAVAVVGGGTSPLPVASGGTGVTGTSSVSATVASTTAWTDTMGVRSYSFKLNPVVVPVGGRLIIPWPGDAISGQNLISATMYCDGGSALVYAGFSSTNILFYNDKLSPITIPANNTIVLYQRIAMVDFVVAQKIPPNVGALTTTADGHGYRKWNSGLLEKWRWRTGQVNTNTAWLSGLFYAVTAAQAWDTAVPFIAPPQEQVSVQMSANGLAWPGVVNPGTATNTSQIYIIAPDSKVAYVYMSWYGVGRWK